jgi:hypothetical protein
MARHPTTTLRAHTGYVLLSLICGDAAVAARVPTQSKQESPIPRLAFVDLSWERVADDFQPPLSGPGPVTHEKDRPYITNNAASSAGTQPTVRIADLSNPILKPWVVERMRQKNELAAAGKEAYEARASCQPGGVPAFLLMGRVNPMYFIQGPKEVVIINEGGPEVRRIYLNVPHLLHPKPTPYGDSVGHYEGGDTLVVDTIGLSDGTYVDNYRTPHTNQLHVVERFKVTNGGETLDVSIYVEDPGAFNTSWSARQTYRRLLSPLSMSLPSLNGQLLEAICAENNNNAIADAAISPIPRATKPDF